MEPEILALLREFPTMPATVIAERIGWPIRFGTVLRTGWPSCGRCSCRPTRVSARLIARASSPSSTCGSRMMAIPLGHGQSDKLWVVVGSMGFSRFLAGWMIPSRESHDVLGGHLEVLRQFRAVPRCAVWDQEGAIGQWQRPQDGLHPGLPGVPGRAGHGRPAVFA